jgi:4-hydroxy-3-methylbut-2-enyl diphosphate reductase
MRIIRAAHMGWCFGVRNAVTLVVREATREPVTVFGELVHNQTVNAVLRARGVQISRQLDEINTDTVIITAHGCSDAMLEQVRRRAVRVVEATCPLVRAAHRAVRELAAVGYYPVIVGQREHVEVRGLTGDLAEFDVVLAPEDVRLLPPRWRYGVVAQTTQPIARVRELAALIAGRFPEAEVKLVDTVCRPTKQRQAAAVELAQQCDVVVVIGGPASNNTRELAETCGRYCSQVFRVETAADLDPAWFANAETVGITAGTSTPDEVIDAVEHRLLALAAELLQGVAA